MSYSYLPHQKDDEEETETQWQYQYQKRFSPGQPAFPSRTHPHSVNDSPNTTASANIFGASTIPSARTNPSTLDSAQGMEMTKEAEIAFRYSFNPQQQEQLEQQQRQNFQEYTNYTPSPKLPPAQSSSTQLASQNSTRTLQNKGHPLSNTIAQTGYATRNDSLFSASSGNTEYFEKNYGTKSKETLKNNMASLSLKETPGAAENQQNTMSKHISSFLRPGEELDIPTVDPVRSLMNRASQMTENVSSASNNETVNTSILFSSASSNANIRNSVPLSANSLQLNILQPDSARVSYSNAIADTLNNNNNNPELFNYNTTAAIPPSDSENGSRGFYANNNSSVMMHGYPQQPKPPFSQSALSFPHNRVFSNQSTSSASQEMLTRSIQLSRKTKKTNHDYHGKKTIMGEHRLITPSSHSNPNSHENTQSESNNLAENKYGTMWQQNQGLRNTAFPDESNFAEKLDIATQPNIAVINTRTTLLFCLGFVIPCLFVYLSFLLSDEKLLALMYHTDSAAHAYIQHYDNHDLKLHKLKTFRLISLGLFAVESCVIILAIVLLLVLARG
ncbi:hypothetical protein ACO0QE_003118 [Hanseniaspora vineae]